MRKRKWKTKADNDKKYHIIFRFIIKLLNYMIKMLFLKYSLIDIFLAVSDEVSTEGKINFRKIQNIKKNIRKIISVSKINILN